MFLVTYCSSKEHLVSLRKKMNYQEQVEKNQLLLYGPNAIRFQIHLHRDGIGKNFWNMYSSDSPNKYGSFRSWFEVTTGYHFFTNKKYENFVIFKTEKEKLKFLLKWSS